MINGQSAVHLAAAGDGDDQDQQHVITDLVHNAVVTGASGADAPPPGLAGHRSAAGRARVGLEPVKRDHHAARDLVIQAAQLAPGGRGTVSTPNAWRRLSCR